MLVKLDRQDLLEMLALLDVMENQEKTDFVVITEIQEKSVLEDHQEPMDLTVSE